MARRAKCKHREAIIEGGRASQALKWSPSDAGFWLMAQISTWQARLVAAERQRIVCISWLVVLAMALVC
jgi:hypothetical protein